MFPSKPLLAAPAPDDLTQVSYPVMASPKLDGVRAIMIDGQLMSRKYLPIGNDHVQALFASLPDGVDGELMVEGESFNATSGALRRKDGEPSAIFHVFDYVTEANKDAAFIERFLDLAEAVESIDNVQVVPHRKVISPDDLGLAHAAHLAGDFEGTMLRDPAGPYKMGRSTQKQGILLKVKPFVDEEAEVIGFREGEQNTNEATKDALGHTKRSTHKEGKVGNGMLGSFHCKFSDGATFWCGGGPGVSHEQRQEWWAERDDLIGCLATIRYQPYPGGRKKGEKPRIPQFHGFRYDV